MQGDKINMINKERYLEVLTRILNDYYNDIKRTNSASRERQQYVDGYLLAARALDACNYDELKKTIDEIHFKVFGKTIQERRQSEVNKAYENNNSLNIPTYVREGISLSEK
jgi:phenylalanyl-tRNA synthetase alpha subunit